MFKKRIDYSYKNYLRKRDYDLIRECEFLDSNIINKIKFKIGGRG
jgi:hypothetical protein